MFGGEVGQGSWPAGVCSIAWEYSKQGMPTYLERVYLCVLVVGLGVLPMPSEDDARGAGLVRLGCLLGLQSAGLGPR